MQGPSLRDACPYCFATITSSEDRFKFWPPWETCPSCKRRFGRDRAGQTVTVGRLYLGIAVFVIVVGLFAYLMLKK